MRRNRLLAGLTTLGVTATLGVALAGSPAGAEPAATPATFPVAFTGETGGAFGYATSRVPCDVDGDRTQDTVVGDWGWDRPGYANTGAGYVLLGGAGLTGGGVANPASGAVRIDGPSVTVTGGAWVGWSVGCLGDVNDDGYDDFALGSGSRNYHSVAVILGRADFGAVDLDNLGADGFFVKDPGAYGTDTDNFGYWVGEVGDVDGDGYDDIGIGDLLADNNGRSNSGRVWIVAGGDSVADVDVSTDTGRVLRTIDGVNAEDRLATVASAGDVTGDGVDDFVVSSYTATPWGSAVAAPGAAYVVFGGAGAPRSLDLANLDQAGFAIYGSQRARDRLGVSVAPAGDVNGDGLADVLVGADGVSSADSGSRTGGVAVVLGSASTATVLTVPESASGYTVFACDDGALDPTCGDSHKVTRGYWIEGQATDAKIGWAVAGAGDVNGDGTPDALIAGSGAGQSAWVVYGQPTLRKKLSLAGLSAAQGFALASGFGRSIGSVGDVDGNGVVDAFAGNNTTNSGRLVLLGELESLTTLGDLADLTVGASASFEVDVEAVATAAAASLSGTLSVTVDGDPVADCTEVPLTGPLSTTCTAPDLPVGQHAVQASFTPSTSGTASFAASGDTGQFEVTKHLASVSDATLSRATAPYGAKAVTASATITAADEATLSGSAALVVDGVARTEKPVPASGTVRFRMPADLALGEHSVLVRYLGTDEIAGADSADTTLRTVKARLRTATTISADPVPLGETGAVRIVLGQLNNRAYPAGEVKLTYLGATSVVSVTAADQGEVSAPLPTATTRQGVATARYLGDATTAGGKVARTSVPLG